ncbi:sensor histidine kinase [Thioalbus denitrificans]|uniref:histidine kinase n=1 Tax=Thioalbus denitrificans TaxID=547122 RepID=A0A369CDC5_9GAMM|nr:HAMP domain-containing sensor histidine kinase [Thioalbus denitrificans]RCX31909.1 signal transduction histidine kinase [Thioalbus denitrificans]
MRFRRSLRARVVLAFALFGAGLSLLLMAGLFVAVHDLERRLVDEALTAELEDYISRRNRNPHSPPPDTTTVRGFVEPSERFSRDIPAAVRSLPEGRHALVLADRPYLVAVAERHGSRFWLLYDESQVLRRERQIILILAGAALLMTLLSAAGGLWLAGRVIAPVSQLSRRVQTLGPGDLPAALGQDYPRDEVGELARAFERFQRRLQAFIRRERAFTADISHELRTPLAVISGAAEVLLTDPALESRARARVERIARAVDEMGELTSALLVLAREEAGEAVTTAQCDVDSLIHEIVEKHRHLLRDKPVTVELGADDSPCVAAERTLLAVVLGNLVRNAFTYTRAGRIRIHLDRDGVVVEDTGPGLPQELGERILEPHVSGPGSAGAGIGLSLVRRICNRYGWRLELASQSGEGTRARLRFGSQHTPS